MDSPDRSHLAKERLLQVAEETHEAIAISAPDGTFRYTNPAYEAMHGYDPGELVGQPPSVLNAASDPEGAVQAIIDAVYEDGYWEGPIDNRRKDGTAFRSYALVTGLKDNSGRIQNLVTTKHRLAEGEDIPVHARREHQKIADLAQVIPGMVYQCLNDDRWTMKQLTGEVEAITGYPPEALIDNREIAYADLIHPDERNRIYKAVQDQLSRGPTYQFRYRIIAGDGSERTLWEKGRLKGFDADGTGLLEGYIVDISEQEATRRQLEETESRYRVLFEAINDAAFVHPIGPDGEPGAFVEVNEVACRRLGYTRKQLLRMTPRDLDAPENLAQMPSTIAEIQSKGEAIFETEHVARDGTRIPVEISARLFQFDGEPAVFSLARDLRAAKARERLLLRMNRALAVLSHSNHALIRSDTEHDLLANATTGIASAGEYPFVAVLRVDQADDGSLALRDVQMAGSQNDRVDRSDFETVLERSDGDDPLLAAIRTRELSLARWEEGGPLSGWQKGLADAGLQAAALLPLANEQLTGLLVLASEDAQAFDYTGEMELLQEAADDLNFGIHALAVRQALKESLDQREAALTDTIRAIARVAEERDPYTAGHQDKVADLAVAIGTEMGLDQERLEGLQLGAWVHDIGKVKVPTDILNKPGKLSDAEFAVIQEHPEAGSRIVSGINFPWPVEDMIRHHHERMDGSGYPDGLSGEALSTEVRILAVADVVEAVTSHRPYRPGLGMDKAMAILRDQRGTKLAEEPVDACLSLLAEGRLDWGEGEHRD